MPNTITKTETINLFVPGRLCLFGEHSDWAGLHRIFNADITPGAAIVTGIEQGIYAEVEKSSNFVMYNEAPELSDTWVNFESSMQTDELRSIAESGSYFSYAAGVASFIKDHYSIEGLKITIKKMTLPMKKGLSSSAAICVLVARAFNKLYGLNLNLRGEMDIAFKGEQRTPSRCGRLDQACAFGSVPVLMEFNGDDLYIKKLITKGNFYWVFCDLEAEKDTIKILRDLNKCYPFAETDTEKNVHKALGIMNRQIIEKAVDNLKNGEAEKLGSLMTEAQSIFDVMVAPASITELKAPKLHSFFDDQVIKTLTYGAKGVGSQGDGSIQFLAKDANTQDELCQYLSKQGLTPYKLTIAPQHHVRKAIIPVAGFGTRLYPATRRIKKDMMPLLDKDGFLKPALLILLEQVVEAGIEEICLVVSSKDDYKTYEDFFLTPLSSEHMDKLPKEMKKYEQKIKNIGEKLTYRIQNERLGFGHAVYQCQDFCASEPVLLLLGDTVYTTNNKNNTTQQLIEFYDKLEKPLIAIHKIPLKDVIHYGILSGTWLDTSCTIMNVTDFVEKPDIPYAENKLIMQNKENDKENYAIFGQYILPVEIFDVLKTQIENTSNYPMEFNMTDALCSYIGNGLTGVVLDGKMHDIGIPEAYFNTMNSFINNNV